MARSLSEQVVVITGASSGIGRVTALRLAKKGAALVLAARREEPLGSLETECRGLGARCVGVPTDVSQASEVQELAQRAVRAFGRIDAWVNNAGVYALGSLEETPLETYRRLMDVNYFGTVYGTRAAVEQMRRQGTGGTIVNVSSMAGSMGAAYGSAYVATKHAVRGFTQSVRQELLGTGIELCTVMPVGIDTPLFEHSANYTGYEIRPPEPVYPPERVARRITRLLRRPRAEAYVGNNGPVFGAFRHLAPGAFDRVMRAQMESLHFKSTHQADTEGNLYQPVRQGTGVHGEFHGRSKSWLRRALVWGALGYGVVQLRRRLVEA
jgi:short-subunit dehydrogenase